MAGRGFLEVARELAAGPTPYHWRTAVVNAYYALFLECRDALSAWGFALPPRDNAHAWVRLRCTYATDADLKRIGDALDKLVKRRNPASYDLRSLPLFSTSTVAYEAIQQTTNALAVLDSIHGDPVRRAAARAAIRP
jgi:hypothetical protein